MFFSSISILKTKISPKRYVKITNNFHHCALFVETFEVDPVLIVLTNFFTSTGCTLNCSIPALTYEN